MKKLIPKHQSRRFISKNQEGGLLDKIKTVGTELGKAALPGYYTWESGKEVYNDIMDDNVPLGETLKDTGKFILNAGLDGITLIPGGAAVTIPAKAARAAKATSRLSQAANRVRAAERAGQQYLRVGNRAMAKEASNIEKASMRQAAKQVKETTKASESLFKTRKIARTWPVAVGTSTVGKGIVNNSTDNLVEKRNNPYLYNNFTH